MNRNKILAITLSVFTIGTSTILHNTKRSYASEQCIIVPNVTLPRQKSLISSDARNWYNDQIHNIPNILATQNVTSAEETAHLSFLYRNYFKKVARDSMSCSNCANFLNQNEKPYTFEQLHSKYNGDFNKIAESSMKSRETVNILSRISDFFEILMPETYEKILFPLAMRLSKLPQYLISFFS